MYDVNIYLNGERGVKVPCVCDACGVDFLLSKKDLFRPHSTNQKFLCCSRSCRKTFMLKRCEVDCLQCGKLFSKRNSEIKKTPNNFCSQSCSGTYNNTHKVKGTRRSKLEVWLEEQLTLLYPDLEILYSDKTTINSELDIYIPSMKLAFELNGIFHYEPIYGENKMNQIQNNDNRKFQACIEKGIELCIIDTSGQKYFKELTSQKYLDIIINILNVKLVRVENFEIST